MVAVVLPAIELLAIMRANAAHQRPAASGQADHIFNVTI